MDRRILLFIFSLISMIEGMKAQDNFQFLFDVDCKKTIDIADIDGNMYKNVVLRLKTQKRPGNKRSLLPHKTKGVAVTIKDNKGLTILKRNYHKSFLVNYEDDSLAVLEDEDRVHVVIGELTDDAYINNNAEFGSGWGIVIRTIPKTEKF